MFDAIRFRRDIAVLLFLLHWGTYAYFWQWRGWNESSRLILTYSLVDSGTIAVDQLRTQSSDIAYVNGHYYSYKPPGQSFLGVPIYALLSLGGVSHPDVPSSGFGREPRPLTVAAALPHQLRYWWPDHVLTVLTSGAATAVLVVLIYASALRLGCSQGRAVLVATAYGLGTPALTQATLYCGHQVAACAGFAAFMAVWSTETRKQSRPALLLGGLLSGFAVIAEYSMLLLAVGLAVLAAFRAGSTRNLMYFLLPAILCAVALALYHTTAFGGPFTTGYQYSVVAEYREIYTPENPGGLVAPSFSRAAKILGSGRGLLWYAPVAALAPFGLVSLLRQRHNQVAAISALAFGSVFLINASHPTWEGGGSTGPRYLLASLPFLALPIAALVARTRRSFGFALAALGFWGFGVCLACAAIPEGGRLPHLGPGGADPLPNLVVGRVVDGEFGRNVGNVLLYGAWTGPRTANWWSLMPLLDFLALSGGLLAWRARRPSGSDRKAEQIQEIRGDAPSH